MTAEQVQEKMGDLLAQERNNPYTQWWLSFCDPSREKGTQFLGVCIVEAPGFLHAQQKTHLLGINPGGEIQGCEVENISTEYLNKLLTRDQLQEAGFI